MAAPRDEVTYVYAIQCRYYVKIGVAESPLGRLQALQTSSPFELRLLDKIELPDREAAFRIETATHDTLRPQHVRGEWFRRRPLDPVAVLHGYFYAYQLLLERFGPRYWEADGFQQHAEEMLRA